MSKHEETLKQSEQADGIGTLDDGKRKVRPIDTLLYWGLLWIPIISISLSLFVLGLGRLMTFVFHFDLPDFYYTGGYILAVVVAFFTYVTRMAKIPTAYVGIPTFLGERIDDFLFTEGYHFSGVFGVIPMPKQLFQSKGVVTVKTAQQIEVEMDYKFQWFIYNSLRHSQLDHATKAYKEDGTIDEETLRHSDENQARHIIGRSLTDLAIQHSAKELMAMDVSRLTQEIVDAIKNRPGEEDDDLRVKTFGIEFIEDQFIVTDIRFKDPKMQQAVESAELEKGQRSGQEIELAAIMDTQKALARRKGVSGEVALASSLAIARIPNATIETIAVNGADSALARAAAINSRGKKNKE